MEVHSISLPSSGQWKKISPSSQNSSVHPTTTSSTWLMVEVTNCTCSVDEEILTQIFSSAGIDPPASVQCGPSFKTTIGYVEYQDAETAHRVMVQLQGQKIYDEGCVLNISLPEPVPSPTPPPLSLPEGYTFQQQLSGDGCMSHVVKAHDERRGQMVVLKHATYEEKHRYIERELAILQQCEAHPHVVQLVEKELVDGWLVVECMGGGSFETECKVPQNLTHQEVLAIATATAEALASLHDLGIVHRDVKPHNIFFDRDEHNQITSIKLADMGLAEQLPNGLSEVSFAGTQKYAPPEALQNRAAPASDMWSWACTVAQLATGVKPYEGDNKDIPYSAELNDSELPVEVSDLLTRCFAQQTTQRPSARRVHECCKQCLQKIAQNREVSLLNLNTHSATQQRSKTGKQRQPSEVSKYRPPNPSYNILAPHHEDPFSEANYIDRAAAKANQRSTENDGISVRAGTGSTPMIE